MFSVYSSFTLRIDGVVILGMQCPAECRNRLVVKGLVTLLNQSVATFCWTLHSQNHNAIYSQRKKSVLGGAIAQRKGAICTMIVNVDTITNSNNIYDQRTHSSTLISE